MCSSRGHHGACTWPCRATATAEQCAGQCARQPRVRPQTAQPPATHRGTWMPDPAHAPAPHLPAWPAGPQRLLAGCRRLPLLQRCAQVVEHCLPAGQQRSPAGQRHPLACCCRCHCRCCSCCPALQRTAAAGSLLGSWSSSKRSARSGQQLNGTQKHAQTHEELRNATLAAPAAAVPTHRCSAAGTPPCPAGMCSCRQPCPSSAARQHN